MAAVNEAVQAAIVSLGAVKDNQITATFNRIKNSIARSMAASASAVSRQVSAIKSSLASIPKNLSVSIGATVVQRFKAANDALGGSLGAQVAPGYALGGMVNNNSSSSTNVNSQATFNVYGSDAKAAATQAAKINSDLTLRNVKAVLL